MVEYLIIFLALSILISSWTLGLRIISDKGMVLYPLRKFVLSINSKKRNELKKALDEFPKTIEKHLLSEYGTKEEYELLLEQEEKFKMKLFYLDWWHKPLITCAACMCSFHGFTISFLMMLATGQSKVLLISPISIMLSVVINVFIFRKYEKR